MNHEKWVSEKLDDKPKKAKIKIIKDNIPDYLARVEAGKELWQLSMTHMVIYLIMMN